MSGDGGDYGGDVCVCTCLNCVLSRTRGDKGTSERTLLCVTHILFVEADLWEVNCTPLLILESL